MSYFSVAEQWEIVRTKGPGELLTGNDVWEMKYSWNVVPEVRRIASPVQGGLREVIAPSIMLASTFPKDWKVNINLVSTFGWPFQCTFQLMTFAHVYRFTGTLT